MYWCQFKGYTGAARFLSAHAKEETAHAEKLFNYINETGSHAIIGAIEAPSSQFESLRSVFEKIFSHEQMITKKIFSLVELSLELKNFSTFGFLQWYTSEQHEEEALFNGILEKFELIGEEGRGLFMIDREIGNLVQ